MLQVSPVSAASAISTARRNIAFEDVIAQNPEEDNNDNENLTGTICENFNVLQAAVAKIVPARNDYNTHHVFCLVAPAEHISSDAEDHVGDGTE